MSDYIVSARKYRPSTFASVVGQKSLTATLKNAIDSRRLAQAYLFCGPRGVGKTSCARIFARTINCLSPTPDGEACGHCDSCVAMEQGNSYNIIELDAASNNSVDDIRNLTEQVNVPPQVGNYRVFIIDEVHMLTTQAFNAFLKTLEEPPKYVIFILATTEKHKVIPTILSRCQIYDFKRITTADMADHLKYVAGCEGIEAEPEALNVIARKADGAMRDALSIFDQVAASSMGHITYQSALANLNVLDYDYYFRLVEAFRAADVAQALLLFSEVREKGFDALFFVNGLASHVRDLMVAADSRTSGLLEVAEDMIPRYSEQAASLPLQWYYAAMKILNDCDYNYRTATNKQLLVELALIRLCQLLDPPQPPFSRIDDEPPLHTVHVAPAGGGVSRPPQESAPASQAAPVSVAPGVTSAPSPVASQVSAPVSAHPSGVSPASPAQHPAPTPVAPRPAASATSTAAAPATPAAQRVRKRAASTRLSDLDATTTVSSGTTQQRQPVSEELLREPWGMFIAAHADKHMLVETMRTSFPTQVGPEEFRLLVGHPGQLEAFKTYNQLLLEFLREKLHNDFLYISVAVDDSVEIVKPMAPHELFKDILEKNPVIASFMQTIDPEIV